MLINLLPQAVNAYVCWRWTHFPKTFWKIAIFHAIGIFITFWWVFRLVTLLGFSKTYLALFIAALASSFVNFAVSGALLLITHVVGRGRENKNVPVAVPKFEPAPEYVQMGTICHPRAAETVAASMPSQSLSESQVMKTSDRLGEALELLKPLIDQAKKNRWL